VASQDVRPSSLRSPMSITTESLDKGLNESGLAVGVGGTALGASVAVDAGGVVGTALGASVAVNAGGVVGTALGASVAVDAGGAVDGPAQEDKIITKSASHNMTVLIVLLLKSLDSKRLLTPFMS
jgi:hypothetical protein